MNNDQISAVLSAYVTLEDLCNLLDNTLCDKEEEIGTIKSILQELKDNFPEVAAEVNYCDSLLVGLEN